MFRYVFRWSVVLAFLLGCVSAPAGTARADASRSMAHYIMGVSYEFQNEPDKALMEYQKAVVQDPSSFPAQMRLGILNAQFGNTSRAIKALTSAIQIDPADLQARYLLALAYSSVKDYDRAAQQYETILKTFTALEPKNVEFYIYLADLYYSQGKIDQAMAQFEKVIALQPRNTDALLQVGAFYLESKKRAEGIGLLQRCLDVDPAQGDCLNALGYAYAEDGVHLDDAGKMVAKALAADPENPAYLDSLGWVYYKQGKLQDALDLLQKALVREKDPAIYDHIGDVYEKLGRTDKALEMWQKAYAIDDSMNTVKAKIDRVQDVTPKK